MGTTILESLSNKKLIAIISILLAVQLVCFCIGALFTPSPTSAETFTAVHCQRHNRHQLAIPRHHKSSGSHYVGQNCNLTSTLAIEETDSRQDSETTTFAFQLPLPRGRFDVAYSRWMQNLLILITPEIKYEPLLASSMYGSHQHAEGQFSLLFDVDVAVRNDDDQEWIMYAQRRGLRKTVTFDPHDLKAKRVFDCEPMQLFELQSLHYQYYLVNFEIREDINTNKSFQLTEFNGVSIHYNGGFTQIWLALKSVFFVLTLSTLVWYCGRLNQLERPTTLIERLLVCLGTALTQLNFPVEYFSLSIEIPFMMFFGDLRQGIFYCVLLSFWVIFVGEHLLDGAHRNTQLTNYVKELLAIGVASLALLKFDLGQRGMQTFDPFWEPESNHANTSITVASCGCLAYLVYLVYYIYLAFNTISGKQSAFPRMQITKRLKYQGLIYRFKFILIATTICAISTMVFYGLSHQNNWLGDGSTDIEWTSAMFTTVFSMWNSYVIVLMIFYAPSHKSAPDQIEFHCLTE